jgi:hypothetical protein
VSSSEIQASITAGHTITPSITRTMCHRAIDDSANANIDTNNGKETVRME